jgi:hypothetical protein
MYNCIPMGKIQIQTLNNGYQSVMSKFVQDMEYAKTTILNDLLILTNISFIDHLLKLEMVLAILSINETLL